MSKRISPRGSYLSYYIYCPNVYTVLHSRHIWTFKNVPFCQSIISLQPAHLPWKQVILTIIHLTLFKHTSALSHVVWQICTIIPTPMSLPPILNGGFPPQAGFSHKNLDLPPFKQGGDCETDNRRGCVTFRKRGRRREVGGEQVVVACCALSLSSGCPSPLLPTFWQQKINVRDATYTDYPPRKCE